MGISKRTLELCRQFYLSYPEILQTVSSQSFLSSSHYVCLLSLSSKDERRFYEIETINNNWSLRELRRQISSSLFERLALSREKEKVKELSVKGHIISSSKDLVKDPYVLEFLGLEEKSSYSESDLETAIIDRLEMFY